MKIYPHLWQKLFCEPAMILPGTRQALETALLQHMGLANAPAAADKNAEEEAYDLPAPSADEIDDYARNRKEFSRQMSRSNRVHRIMETYGNVSVIRVDGVIDKRMTDFDLSCYGGCDLSDVDRAIARVAADDKIEKVILDFNSPGGSVIGVDETAARVAALTDTKEVHSFCETLCASAAYYIASQADQVTVASSATIGSIGVYLALLDQTRAMEMEGYKVELIKAGKFKAMGASFKALTEAERAFFQAEVDRLYADFTGAVNSARPQIKSDTMQGQCYRGPAVIERGLADQLTELSLDEYVGNLV